MERAVRTIFYADYHARQMTKKIASGSPLRATMNAVGHMRRDTYGSVLAEVYGEDNGKLYAVVKKDMAGNTHVLYQAKLSKKQME